MNHHNRRKLLVALGATELTAPLPTFAQQCARVWHIGILESGNLEARAHLGAAFKEQLREFGYEVGRNVVIDALGSVMGVRNYSWCFLVQLLGPRHNCGGRWNFR